MYTPLLKPWESHIKPIAMGFGGSDWRDRQVEKEVGGLEFLEWKCLR
jgi:hypothetical protein